MIRRKASARGRTALLALASALAFSLGSVADAYGLHRCEHHDALPGAAAAALEAPSTHPDHTAAGAHPHAGDAGSASDDTDAHDLGCTCVGECTGAGATAVASTAEGAKPQPTPVGTLETAIASDAPLAAHVAHFLPFAQAPPVGR